jgi:hypothetical protein
MSKYRLLLIPFVLVLAACSSGEDNAAGMDGLVDGVPVTEYAGTTTVPPSTSTTTSTTLLPTTTLSPETAVPAEPDADPESAELQAWRAATAAVCDEYEPRIQALAAELAPPETLADTAAYFDRLNPLNARYMRAIVAVPVPEDGRDDVEALHALATELKEVARVAQAAAHFEDQVAVDLATAGLAASGAAANELLLELDLPECVAEADGGSA